MCLYPLGQEVLYLLHGWEVCLYPWVKEVPPTWVGSVLVPLGSGGTSYLSGKCACTPGVRRYLLPGWEVCLYPWGQEVPPTWVGRVLVPLGSGGTSYLGGKCACTPGARAELTQPPSGPGQHHVQICRPRYFNNSGETCPSPVRVLLLTWEFIHNFAKST